jgi:ABC-type polysaccharide/polyol phosphate export permease
VTTIQITRPPVARPPISPPSLLRASSTIVWRNLVHIRRMPEMLLDVTVQSVMFVLLFAYVFGGAIAVAGSNYREFLLPGIMVQTMVFSSAVVAMGLTNDLQKGIVDRFKSLPIARSAVLVGRSISSLIHSSIGVAVMGLTGLLIGWRIHNGVVDAVLASCCCCCSGSPSSGWASGSAR